MPQGRKKPTINSELDRIQREILEIGDGITTETQAKQVVFGNEDVPRYISWFQRLQEESANRPLPLA